MYVEVSIHRPLSALEMGKIYDFKRHTKLKNSKFQLNVLEMALMVHWEKTSEVKLKFSELCVFCTK